MEGKSKPPPRRRLPNQFKIELREDRCLRPGSFRSVVFSFRPLESFVEVLVSPATRRWRLTSTNGLLPLFVRPSPDPRASDLPAKHLNRAKRQCASQKVQEFAPSRTPSLPCDFFPKRRSFSFARRSRGSVRVKFPSARAFC